MRVLALCLLVVLTCALRTQPEEVHAKHSSQIIAAVQTLQGIPARAQEVVDRISKRAVALQDVAACVAASEVFIAVWNTSCSAVTGVFNPDTNQTTLDAIINTYCVVKDSNNHTCQQKVDVAFADYLLQCGAIGQINATELEKDRFLLGASMITCLQDDIDHHYCLNDFYTLSHTNLTMLNFTVLSHICVPCTKKVIDTLVYFGSQDILQTAAYLDLICLQLIPLDFCYLRYVEALRAMATTGPTGFTQEIAELVWCVPCVEAFAYSYVAISYAFGGDPAQIEEELVLIAFHKFSCVTDLKGQYCWPQIQNAQTQLSTMGSSCLPGLLIQNPPTCSSGCKTALQTVQTTLGCCFGTWFNFLRWLSVAAPANYTSIFGGAVSTPPTPDQIASLISTNCQVTIPDGCAQKKLQIVLTLLGLDTAYVLAHVAEFQQVLINYLIYVLHVDNSSITTPQITQGTPINVQSVHTVHHLMSTSPITATVTVTAGSNTQVNNISDAVNNAPTDGNSAILCSMPLSWRDSNNITQCPYPSDSSYTLTADGPNGGVAVGPASLLAVILIMLSLVSL